MRQFFSSVFHYFTSSGRDNGLEAWPRQSEIGSQRRTTEGSLSSSETTLNDATTIKPVPTSRKIGVGRKPADLDMEKGERQEAKHANGNGNETRFQKTIRVLKHHGKFIGPGIMASVAYLDPGNYSTDLAAGSQYGYAHLFVVLFSGISAVFLQVLATRLGCVTGKDLAQQCRKNMYYRKNNTLAWRVLLWFIYVVAEVAIVFTDLAELLGTAIALNLLIPRIPLWAGILLTSLDVFVILFMFNSYPGRFVTRSMRIFELVIGLMVLAVLGSFIGLIAKLEPDWGDLFKGFVPSEKIIGDGGLYTAVGIVGATVMPHAIFLGSRLATMERVPSEEWSPESKPHPDSQLATVQPSPGHSPYPRSPAAAAHVRVHLPQPYNVPASALSVSPTGGGMLSPGRRDRSRPASTTDSDVTDTEAQMKKIPIEDQEFVPPTLACIRAHLPHAVADIVSSLLAFALLVNSAILIVGSAGFFYGDTRGQEVDGDLFQAHDLIKQTIGGAPAFLFAFALLASGQSASITATLAGQVVSEGFINWKTSPWVRRLATRSIGIVPSLIVAVAVGKKGLNTMLVASQVGLSFALPFVVTPLVLATTSQKLMSVINPSSENDAADGEPTTESSKAKKSFVDYLKIINPFRRRIIPSRFKNMVSFANPVWVIQLGWALIILITLANAYAIIALALGQG